MRLAPLLWTLLHTAAALDKRNTNDVNHNRDNVASVTFVGTSNNVTATVSRRIGQALRDVITQSEVFQTAFGLSKEGSPFSDSPKPSRRTAAPKPVPSIIQSSESARPVQAAGHGLVSAIVDAYNNHHRLILRPDDVWQAILTQFSFFVNANAEDLRDSFVDFKGKKTLEINMPGTLFAADFASFANKMVDEKIAASLKDAEVTAWLLPNFSTTKSPDGVAASITIMSTLQTYFEYAFSMMCGIPEVTLEGTPADWRLLRQKIDRLPQYDVRGKDPVLRKWHELLAPVLDQFVRSSEGRPDLDFWDTVCSHSGGGSGPSYLSGWVTVFACFKANGDWQGNVPKIPPDGYGYHQNTHGEWVPEEPWTPKWPFIDTDMLPVGAVAVPVLVDDNGIQYDTQMLAGQFGYEMTGRENLLNTVRPRTDWCIAYEGAPKLQPRNYKDGDIRQCDASLSCQQ